MMGREARQDARDNKLSLHTDGIVYLAMQLSPPCSVLLSFRQGKAVDRRKPLPLSLTHSIAWAVRPSPSPFECAAAAAAAVKPRVSSPRSLPTKPQATNNQARWSHGRPVLLQFLPLLVDIALEVSPSCSEVCPPRRACSVPMRRPCVVSVATPRLLQSVAI